jgi:tetratricopeptide (TPR) repeat protein
MSILKSIFEKLFGKSGSSNVSTDPVNDCELREKSEKETYEQLSGELVEKLSSFRMKYSVHLRGEAYNEKNSAQALPYVEQIFNVFKDLIPLKREYGQDIDVDDYYVYNLSNCYVSLKKYDEAYEILKYGFSNLREDEIYNLTNSLEHYLTNVLLDNKVDKFFEFYEEMKTGIPEKDKKRFRRHMEKELTAYFEQNLQNLDFKELEKKFGNIYIFKKIYGKTLENKKVFENIDEAKVLYNKKEYEAARDKFAIAVENSNKIGVEIGKHYELYGDIHFRLSNYELARSAYNNSISDTSYKHRVYKKIGDTYKREEAHKKAFFAYLLSVARKTDYKTSQNMIEKLNFGHELKKILEFCEKHSSLEENEFKKMAQKHFELN